MSRTREEGGQSVVVVVLFLTVVLGMAALVVDIGSWYRQDRAVQAAADAAALAGAQALPDNPVQAVSLALSYADKNGGGVEATDLALSTTVLPNDTIAVYGDRPAPGFFAKLFGIDSATVEARAKARGGIPSAARWVAPIAVSELHPMVVCRCFGPSFPTEVQLADLHAPGGSDAAGAFALLELDRGGGSAGESTVAGWMSEGYDAYMPLGIYNSVPSAMFNGNAFRRALQFRMQDDVLLPLYRPPIRRGGSTARFDIVGWIGFHLTGTSGGGSNARLRGYFTRVIWEGILSESPAQMDYGVRAVTLVE